MEINKLIGYVEIEIQGETIPVKIGSFALERFCEKMGTQLSEIHTLFDIVETQDKEGKAVGVPVPKKPLDFLARLLWAGASYVKMAETGTGYPEAIGYEWVDYLGGAQYQNVQHIYEIFFQCVLNGGVPYSQVSDKKKETEQSPLQT